MTFEEYIVESLFYAMISGMTIGVFIGFILKISAYFIQD